MKLECIFFERQKWDSCRLCDGDNTECPEYLLRNPTRQTKLMASSLTAKDGVNLDKPAEINHYPNATYCNEVDNSPDGSMGNLELGSITSPKRHPDEPFYIKHNQIHEFIKPQSISTIRKYDRGAI
jgi:hypothetical protein